MVAKVLHLSVKCVCVINFVFFYLLLGLQMVITDVSDEASKKCDHGLDAVFFFNFHIPEIVWSQKISIPPP